MPLRSGFLSTRVGRRTLLNFLAAALLPVAVSSLVGIAYIRQTLETESIERIRQTSKGVVSLIIGALLQGRTSATDSLAAVSAPDLDPAALEHLAAAKTLLRLADAIPDGTPPRIQFLTAGPAGGVVAREWSAEHLWRTLDEHVDIERTVLCVFDGSGRRIHCSGSVSPETETTLRAIAMSDSSGSVNAERWLVARRSVFLQYELGAGEWQVVTAELRETALAPVAAVTTSLALLVALAMISAFAFAHRQIRRSTEPLSVLHDATKRVADGDLTSQVRISSKDEYADLGRAFNTMTLALSQQVQLLERMDEVDHATLKDRQIDAIARTAVNGLRAATAAIRTGIAVFDENAEASRTQWVVEGDADAPVVSTDMTAPSERRWLIAHARHSARPLVSAHDTSVSGESSVVRHSFPLFHDDELLGDVSLDLPADTPDMAVVIASARRLADRIALGVANVRLLTRLDALSTGTLLAFARAIDANSPWTAGHSERVTRLAMRLGQALSLSGAELSALCRGGLMHDIGKIGIPPEILDKASRLTDAERTVIERHPEIGERILKPIPGFADALALVRSHHERLDGTGYPDRLVGEDIPWLARILAVADVYDALASDRPYRAGLSPRAAMTMIEQQSGSHFDPRVVDALMSIAGEIADGRLAPESSPAFSAIGFTTGFPAHERHRTAADAVDSSHLLVPAP